MCICTKSSIGLIFLQSPTVLDMVPLIFSMSYHDYKKLKNSFYVHIAHIVVEHIPFFPEKFRNLAESYIPHQFSSEMATKSDVVS